MKKQHILVAGIAVAVSATLALTGCSGAASTSTASASVLKVVSLSKPANLNPALNNIDTGVWYTELAYASLIKIGAEGKLLPGLASSWRYVGEGNRKFEVTIRDNAKFADGTPVTAAAVAASLNYSLKAGGPAGGFLSTISTITATDEKTVQLVTSSANPEMPFLLANTVQFGDIISPAGLKDPKALSNSTAGAGPNVLDASATVSGDHYTYKQNPNYFDKAAQHYDSVTIKVVSDTNAALSVLKTGAADVGLGDLNTAASAKSSGLKVYIAPVAQSGIDFINRTDDAANPLGNQLVRQALNYAIDRKTIAKSLLQGYGQAVNQVGAPGTSDYLTAAANQYPYDPAKAKALLAEAGYPDGFSSTMVAFSQNPPTGDIAQAVVSDWQKIGVKVAISADSTGDAYVQDINSKKFPMFSYGYGYIPFFLYTQSWYLPINNPFNPFVSDDAKLTSLVGQANAASGDAAQKLKDEATQRAMDLAWIAPVASYSVFYFTAASIKDPQVSGNRPLLDITDIQPVR